MQYGPPVGWQYAAKPLVITAAATDVDIATNFKGDTWRIVRITCYIVGAAGSANLTLQPNAVATNQIATTFGISNGAVSSVIDAQYTDLRISPGAIGNGDIGLITITLAPKTGQVRPYQALFAAGIGTPLNSFVVSGEWQDTSTEITSLRIHSDVANSIAAGSYFLVEGIAF